MSPSPPAWLPATIPYQGDWDAFIRTLYSVFETDFKSGNLVFQGCPVWHDRRLDPDDAYHFEEAFWHLVTRDDWVYNPKTRKKEKQRLPENDRASHLPWARPMLVQTNVPEIVVWKFEDITSRGSAIRTYIWLKDWDYVVVLEKQAKAKGNIFRLITAFLLDVPAKRTDMESRYARRLK